MAQTCLYLERQASFIASPCPDEVTDLTPRIPRKLEGNCSAGHRHSHLENAAQCTSGCNAKAALQNRETLPKSAMGRLYPLGLSEGIVRNLANCDHRSDWLQSTPSLLICCDIRIVY